MRGAGAPSPSKKQCPTLRNSGAGQGILQMCVMLSMVCTSLELPPDNEV